MVTPFSNSVMYSTRRKSRGLLVPSLEPERVYRRRENRIARHRILACLGEETISYIHLLFLLNNHLITSPVDAIYKPCDFSNIQGSPHIIPNKALEKLPSFQGNNAISAKAHI